MIMSPLDDSIRVCLIFTSLLIVASFAFTRYVFGYKICYQDTIKPQNEDRVQISKQTNKALLLIGYLFIVFTISFCVDGYSKLFYFLPQIGKIPPQLEMVADTASTITFNALFNLILSRFFIEYSKSFMKRVTAIISLVLLFNLFFGLAGASWIPISFFGNFITIPFLLYIFLNYKKSHSPELQNYFKIGAILFFFYFLSILAMNFAPKEYYPLYESFHYFILCFSGIFLIIVSDKEMGEVVIHHARTKLNN